jgi:hypothetical protein
MISARPICEEAPPGPPYLHLGLAAAALCASPAADDLLAWHGVAVGCAWQMAPGRLKPASLTGPACARPVRAWALPVRPRARSRAHASSIMHDITWEMGGQGRTETIYTPAVVLKQEYHLSSPPVYSCSTAH